jgi:1-carboxybiuret hydrolase
MPVAALGAAEIVAAVRGSRLSAVAVAEAVLARIAERNAPLNIYTAVMAERTLAEARAVDAKIAVGVDPGLLAGVPYGVKDLFDIAGRTTLAGSAINAADPPADADAVLVQRLTAAGAVLLGIQNMDEYAYGFTTENAHYGVTRNPHDTSRVAGGSSGGSAAAVAAGLGAFALGSDTNGSIRVPSSFCGIFGLKPTYGRLSCTGSFPFVHALDHLGPFARNVRDLALVYDTLQGPDDTDPVCAATSVEPVLPQLSALETLRVARLDGWFRDMAGPEAVDAVDHVAAALGARSSVVLRDAAAARSAAYLITATEGASLHMQRLRERAADFDPAVRDRLFAGALFPAWMVVQAQQLRRRFREDALALFRDADVLLAPATPCPAPQIGQPTIRMAGADWPTRANIGVLTQPISFIGLPVVSVPVWLPGRLPIGVQLIGPPWREDLVLRAAARLEADGIVSAAGVN